MTGERDDQQADQQSDEIRQAAEVMIEAGYLRRYYVGDVEMWQITDAGYDYLAVLQEHDEGGENG